MIRFVVVPRKGYNFDPAVNWFLKAPHVYVSDEDPVSEISSTQIRKWFGEGNTAQLEKHMDKNVLDYIIKNGLYA